MNKYAKIVSVIAVIGALACLPSFVIAIARGRLIPAIIFGAAGLFCISFAVAAIKRKNK